MIRNSYILCGGQSSRMGMDKALLVLEGRTIIELLIDILGTFSDGIYLVGAKEKYPFLHLPVLDDSEEGHGPSMGIYSALDHCAEERALIVGVDMPFVGRAIQELIRESGKNPTEWDILCFRDELIYPLPGIYNTTICKEWKERLDSGERKLQNILSSFRMKNISKDSGTEWMNINTPEDYQQARQVSGEYFK